MKNKIYPSYCSCKEYPIKLQELIKKNCKEQNKNYEPKGYLSTQFNWEFTVEGHSFWKNICYTGDLTEFYELYYKENKNNLNYIIENINPGVYKAFSKDKKYEITIKQIINDN